MQKQKNEYLEEFQFLIDLINLFTKKAGIHNKLFYFMIRRNIKGTSLLQGFVYDERGLSSTKEVFRIYKSQETVHDIVPYLASLSRLLSTIYQKASSRIGEDRAQKLLKNSIKVLRKKYSKEPDLRGYVPYESLGKAAAAAAAAAAALDVSLVDNLFNYMLKDIIGKGIAPAERKVETKATKKSPENMKENLRKVYVEMLGPLGGRQFDKLDKVNINTISDQINAWKDKGIISEEKAQKLRERVGLILDVRNEVK